MQEAGPFHAQHAEGVKPYRTLMILRGSIQFEDVMRKRVATESQGALEGEIADLLCFLSSLS